MGKPEEGGRAVTINRREAIPSKRWVDGAISREWDETSPLSLPFAGHLSGHRKISGVLREQGSFGIILVSLTVLYYAQMRAIAVVWAPRSRVGSLSRCSTTRTQAVSSRCTWPATLRVLLLLSLMYVYYMSPIFIYRTELLCCVWHSISFQKIPHYESCSKYIKRHESIVQVRLSLHKYKPYIYTYA